MDRLGLEQLEEVRARLAQRPPDAAFTAAEAAIYTGRSTRTLKRAIDAGVGPRREKNPDVSGLGATNRHTRYRKADLDAWRESLVAFATSFRDFGDLTLDAPWRLKGDRLFGHLLDTADAEAVLQLLSDDAVIFLRIDEALQCDWASPEQRMPYQALFEALCLDAVRKAQAVGEQRAMEQATELALGSSKAPLRP